MKASALGAALAIVASGCASVSVRSNAEAGADLSKYKTFAWYDSPIQKGRANTAEAREIESAVSENLAAKGIVKATTAKPDFLIGHYVSEQRRALPPDEWQYVLWGPELNDVPTYKQKILIIDFVDPQTKKVLWKGSATNVVGRPNSPHVDKLRKAIATMISAYPAGPGAPPPAGK